MSLAAYFLKIGDIGKMEYEYRLQKPDGSLDAPIKVGWDLKANRRV